jgi:predicted RNA-binding Zn-ribbon protein involved in translation (DUF1610 family)
MAFVVIGVLLIALVGVPIALLLLRSGNPVKDVRQLVRKPATDEPEAIEVLPGPRAANDGDRVEPGPPEESVVLECPACGQVNRIPVSSTGSSTFRCAKCKQTLPSFEP